ncbi:unnamed protein product [Closterium sp. NIES-53]
MAPTTYYLAMAPITYCGGPRGLGVAGWGVAGEWRPLLLLLLRLPLLQLPLRGVDFRLQWLIVLQVQQLHASLPPSCARLPPLVPLWFPPSGRDGTCVDGDTYAPLSKFCLERGFGLFTLHTNSPQVALPGQVVASGQISSSCYCRSLTHPTVLRHHRLGHLCLLCLRSMVSQRLVSSLLHVFESLPPSHALRRTPCVKGRLRTNAHSSSLCPATAPFQTLHLDDEGPAPCPGLERESYFLVVVDEYSHYTMVFPLAKKSNVSSTPIRWLLATEATRGSRVVCLHSDHGDEFRYGILRGFSNEWGITQSWALAKSPQQNRVADCRIGLVMEIAHTSMIHAHAPHFFRGPTRLWTASPGVASEFRVWDCLALVRSTSADKLSARALPCVFLGFLVDAPDFTIFLVMSSLKSLYRTTSATPVEVPPLPHCCLRSHCSNRRHYGGVGVGGTGAGAASPGGAGAGGAGSGGVGAGGATEVGAGESGVGAAAARATAVGAAAAAPAAATTADAAAASFAAVVPACEWPLSPWSPFLLCGPLTASYFSWSSSTGLVPDCFLSSSHGRLLLLSHTIGLFTVARVFSSLTTSSYPFTRYYRAARPGVSHVLASLVMVPRASLSFVLAHVATVVALVATVGEFAATRHLDYATRMVAAHPTCPLSAKGESALGCDVIEDSQFELEFLAATSPHLCAMLLAHEGDPDALYIPTPRTYREAVSG